VFIRINYASAGAKAIRNLRKRLAGRCFGMQI
jgi:hypothetical protein